MERWKPVANFDGYEVSDLGRVRSRGRILKPRRVGDGYLQVKLRGVQRYIQVLVLETFVGPRPPGFYARHFPDFAKSNNALTNLSWCTPSRNALDRGRPEAKLSAEHLATVVTMRRDGASQRTIGAAIGASQPWVCRLIKRLGL